MKHSLAAILPPLKFSELLFIKRTFASFKYFCPTLLCFLVAALFGYLDTCPKNDFISFSRKGFCALGLGLELGLGFTVRVDVRVSGNTFSVKVH